MGSFQPRKSDLNKCNWQSHSSHTTHGSFQEKGRPEKPFPMEAGRKAGPVTAAHGPLCVRAGGRRELAESVGCRGTLPRPAARRGSAGQLLTPRAGQPATLAMMRSELGGYQKRTADKSLCICAARRLVIYPRAANRLTLCFGLFPHALIYGLSL